MSLLVTSILVASGVLLGRFLARGRKPADGEEEEENERDKKSEPKKEEPKKEMNPFEDFPCKLGDVIMRSAGEEAWLAGALVLREQSPVAVLFVAPEAKEDRAILARPRPADDLLWLAPIVAKDLGLAGKEPPASLEHKSDRFERTRRIPVRVDRVGSGAPDIGTTGIFAEYTSLAGDRIVVIVGGKEPVAFRGTSLDGGTFTVLPGNGETE